MAKGAGVKEDLPPNTLPRSEPTKAVIRAHWADRIGGDSRGRFDSPAEFLLDDYCFACGFVANTERAHILARNCGGDDSAENIHLLCWSCHRASEPISGEEYWEWFWNRRREDVGAEWMVSRFGLGATILTLNGSPPDRVVRWLAKQRESP